MTNPIKEYVCPGQGSFDHSTLIQKDVSSSPEMSMEVSFQKSTGKLLFVEAKEYFVDFVFGFLAIPLGMLIGTWLMELRLSFVWIIYTKAFRMSVGTYLRSKEVLIKSCFVEQYSSKNLVFSLEGTRTLKQTRSNGYILKDPWIEGGLLKRSGMFMVTDDLVITPSSSFSTMNIVSKLKVPLNDIEKYDISIGLEEV